MTFFKLKRQRSHWWGAHWWPVEERNEIDTFIGGINLIRTLLLAAGTKAVPVPARARNTATEFMV